jgi:hypothetical protein
MCGGIYSRGHTFCKLGAEIFLWIHSCMGWSQPSFVIDEKFNGVTLTTMLFGLEVLDVGGFVMEARTPLNSPPGRPWISEHKSTQGHLRHFIFDKTQIDSMPPLCWESYLVFHGEVKLIHFPTHGCVLTWWPTRTFLSDNNNLAWRCMVKSIIYRWCRASSGKKGGFG